MLPKKQRSHSQLIGYQMLVGGSGGKGRLCLLPADHLPVPVHGDVGLDLVVVRSKVTVGGSKPLIKSMFQGVELRSVT